MLSTPHQRFTCVRLHDPYLTRSMSCLFLTRSPPRLLSAAAVGGLQPPPARRLRRAFLHLLRSTAARRASALPARLRGAQPSAISASGEAANHAHGRQSPDDLPWDISASVMKQTGVKGERPSQCNTRSSSKDRRGTLPSRSPMGQGAYPQALPRRTRFGRSARPSGVTSMALRKFPEPVPGARRTAAVVVCSLRLDDRQVQKPGILRATP